MAETDTPVVSLAGRDWPIPLLAVRQNRIVVPTVMKLMPMFARMFALSQAVSNGDQDAAALLARESLGLTTENFDAIADAVYAALTRGTPGMSRTEFDDMPISVGELMTALPVIAKQSGMQVKPGAMGEAVAGEQPPKSTGTSS